MTESKKFSSLPITDFRNRIGDLARPNLFHIEMGFPDIATKNPFIGGEPGSVADVEQALAGNKGNTGQSNAVTAGLTTVLAKAERTKNVVLTGTPNLVNATRIKGATA